MILLSLFLSFRNPSRLLIWLNIRNKPTIEEIRSIINFQHHKKEATYLPTPKTQKVMLEC